MTDSSRSESRTTRESQAPEPTASLARRRLRLALVTFAVVTALFAALYLLTEDESRAPFGYAIF